MVTLIWFMGLSGIEHRADGADRRIQPFGDLAIGALQPARLHQRSVEFVGQPRAVGAERLDPGRQFVLVAIGFAPPLDRAFQRVERRHQPPRRGVDIGRDGSAWPEPLAGRSLMLTARTFGEPAASAKIRGLGKRLGDEIYVASEASATPLRSYAPQSNFCGPDWGVSTRLGLPGTQMLSSPDFPLPRLVPRHSPTRRIATKHLISGGFSS